ncbi:MAG: TIGR00269 family protein [Nanoarchaeota archaeon]|nr:TIGR00269 family protein [Nanoarchaeota archaeon]
MTCRRNPKLTVKLDPSISKEEFYRTIKGKFLRAIKNNKLIRQSDKILVACSGGKDSMLVLYLMSQHYHAQTTALHVDQGICGVSSPSLKIVKKYCALWDIPLKIVSFKQEFGKTLDQMVKKTDHSPCYVCGVVRRYLINKTAREEGFTKLATGHNLDDEAQSILMNVVMGDLRRQARLGYSTGIVTHKGFVQRIKPLRDVYEKETMINEQLKEWNLFTCNCKYAIDSFRGRMRDLLDDYEAKHPQTKKNIINFYDSKIIPKLAQKQIKPVKNCANCGEPSSQEPCKTCQIINKLKK